MTDGAPRPARPDDVPALARMEARCFGPSAWSAAQIAQELQRAGAVALLIPNEDHVIAYAIGWSLATIHEGELLRIAVDPSRRGRGLGRRLLDAFHAHADATLFLEVRADNGPATRLYERAGYRVIGRRDGYYADGQDALLMSRDPATAPTPPAGPRATEPRSGSSC